MQHSESTKAKISAGQNRPEVVAAKRRASNKYWADVRAGRKPKRAKPAGRPPRSVARRFWDKVRKVSTGCWIFESNHGGTAYGMLSVPKGQEYMAHRISWEIHKGPIPKGCLVLHRCDVPKCVNPEHLFLGSSQTNMDDMVAKGRSLKGEDSPVSQLTEEEVRKIRVRYANGGISQTRLAEEYGVSQTNISHIVRRTTWRHI